MFDLKSHIKHFFTIIKFHIILYKLIKLNILIYKKKEKKMHINAYNDLATSALNINYIIVL
jgi:hypothetical protein